jgi:DNA topoisomerase-1
MAKSKVTSLEHPFDETCFPAHYVARGFKLAGDLIPNKGDDSAEEMLWNFAGKIETDYFLKNQSNFIEHAWIDIQPLLTPNQQKLEWPKDFMPLLKSMRATQVQESEAKKAYNKEHKEEIKQEKEARKAKYGFATLNGKQEPLGNIMIEMPGFFISRGSKLMGRWKYRVQPEDVIINWVSNKPAPKAPAGHHWKKVEANKNALQIVKYTENIGNIYDHPKKILFAATSSTKQNADQKKFEKALKLIKDWDKMEKLIEKGLKSKDKKEQECALIAYLIKTTSIRVGSSDTEGTEIENGVVGASTLRVSNITLSQE